MKRVLTIIGARPQFIKAAMVSKAIQARDSEIQEHLVHTGQHYDDEMSGVFLRQLGLYPDTCLRCGGSSSATQVGKMLLELDPVVKVQKPDVVLVYGDTNSTLAGALAGAYNSIPVAHVEAGLRSHDRTMPEEINRRAVDTMSRYLFCPTMEAMNNLYRESLTFGSSLVGDVMYDAAKAYMWQASISEDLNKILTRPYYLVTCHRQENTDDPECLRSILNQFHRLSAQAAILLPMHPRLNARIEEYGFQNLLQNICIWQPVNYFEMLALEKQAKLIITDSGGVQKEAYFVGTPCITIRTSTEWVETIQAGWNQLVDPLIDGSLEQAVATAKPGTHIKEYGDGHAAEKIVEKLLA